MAMSYIRYDTDSDVYAWGDVDGTFKMSIAQHRRRPDSDPTEPTPAPKPSELPSALEDLEVYKAASQKWYQDHQQELDEYQAAHYETIEHEDAGKTLSFVHLFEMYERATQLLADGLLYPSGSSTQCSTTST